MTDGYKVWAIIMLTLLLTILGFSIASGQEIIVPEGDTLDIRVVTGTDTVTVTDTLVVIDTLYVDRPIVDPVPPVVPQMVSIMGYTSNSEGHWGSQVTWAPQVADSFKVYGGANSGEGPWTAIVPGSFTMHRHPETYTEVTSTFGCVIAYHDEIESTNQCDGMELVPMPPGSWAN